VKKIEHYPLGRAKKKMFLQVGTQNPIFVSDSVITVTKDCEQMNGHWTAVCF